jgi:hypothetical protein
MAGSPRFKVYNAANDYRASFKDASEAAVLVAGLGEGSTIRDGHRSILYTEDANGTAANSYDEVASIVYARLDKKASAAITERTTVAYRCCDGIAFHSFDCPVSPRERKAGAR